MGRIRRERFRFPHRPVRRLLYNVCKENIKLAASVFATPKTTGFWTEANVDVCPDKSKSRLDKKDFNVFQVLVVQHYQLRRGALPAPHRLLQPRPLLFRANQESPFRWMASAFAT